MKRLIALLMILVLSAFVIVGCSNNKATPDESAQGEEAPTEAVRNNYEIKTKIATLKYPEQWKEIVKVEAQDSEPYTVTFSAYDVKVFELFFNGTQGDLLGTLITDDGQYLVTTSMVKVSESSEHYEDYRNIQEDVNVILENLGKDYKFVPGVDAREDNQDVYAISTSIGDLYYPVKWKDRVTVDVTDSKVSFSCEGTPLFDIMIGGETGNLVGRYDGTNILIVDYPLEDADMKNMQEDVNVILNHLQEDEKFDFA